MITRYAIICSLVLSTTFSLTLASTITVAPAKQLTNAGATMPHINNDATKVVFSRIARRKQSIVLLDVNSGNETILATGTDPEISPDGKLVCFVNNYRLSIVNTAGGKSELITTDSWDSSPHFSPDGKKIYFIAAKDKAYGVHVIDLQTRKVTRLTNRNEIDVAPSPNGKYLACVFSESNGARSIGVMKSDGSNLKILRRGKRPSGGYFDPCWSPDSKWLCMVTSSIQPYCDLIAMSIDGKKNIKLTTDNEGNRAPCFAGNGKTIAFVRIAGNGLNLFTMPVDIDSTGITDTLLSQGTAFKSVKSNNVLTIPKPVGPDLSKPLNIKPHVGDVKSILLNGMWQGCFNKNGDSIPTTGWEYFPVPSRFQAYTSSHYLPGQLKSKKFRRFGWFQTQFNAPSIYKKAPYIELFFAGVEGNATYYLNGVKVGSSSIAEIPIRLRIDHLIKWNSPNTLTVFIERPKQRASRAGIRNDVFLKFYPAVHIENVIVRTSVRKKTIESHVYIRNLSDTDLQCTLAGNVREQDGKIALSFDDRKITVPANDITEIVVSRKWKNPILWGFGEFGTPHLYSTGHTITANGQTSKPHYARFGFREFWAQGTRFMFNGKPFFIKGELSYGSFETFHNRGAVQRYFQFLREGNMNFIRHHTNVFFQNLWFDVGDEMGMLVEPQLYLGSASNDHASELAWTNFIYWQAANHPSIVMYSADNEASTTGTGPNPIVWARQNRRAKLIRTLDPTRLVEENGDVGLGLAESMGFYDRLDVFNPHPYSTPLAAAMQKLMLQYRYNGKIPVHVGEMVASFGNDPFNGWTTPGQTIRSRAYQNGYHGAGKKLEIDITSVAKAGASGASLCNAEGICEEGPDVDGKLVFGPWTKHAKFIDRINAKGKLVTGRYGLYCNYFYVTVKWPSYAGKGYHPRYSGGYSRNGLTLNWFDPAYPAFTTNVAMAAVARAFKAADNNVPGPLNDKLPPEVIISLAPDNRPAPHVAITVSPSDSQPVADYTIATDINGTAWFDLPASGKYTASATIGKKTFKTTFEAVNGKLQPKSISGYHHLQFIDLAGSRAETIKSDMLTVPAKLNFINQRKIKNQFAPQEKLKPRRPSFAYAAGPFKADSKGFIRNWLICGPFPNIQNKDTTFKGFATDFLKEHGGEKAIKPRFEMKHKVTYPDDQYWFPGVTKSFWDYTASTTAKIKLNALKAPEMGIITDPPSHLVGYAACYIISEKQINLNLSIGADDGIKAFLNGKQVASFPEHGAAKPDEHIVPITLKAGKNLLLLKIDQSLGGWSFYCRLMSKGIPYSNFKVMMK